MSSIYYTTLTGMLAANYGLQNTSNNIANMQSHGFKRSEVSYSSLGYGNGHDSLGQGVIVNGHTTNFAQGNYTETANPSDLAIVGQGFFIVKLQHGELLYTRDGEFGFNQSGILIDKHSGGTVQGYDKKGNLAPIRQFGPTTSTGKPTHFVNIKGEWIIVELETDPITPENPDPFKSKFEPVQFSIANIFDANGKAHTIRLEFECPGTPGTGKNPFENLKWNLKSASCDDGVITFSPQIIEFDNDNNGVAQKNSETIHLTLNGKQHITINLNTNLSDQESSVRLYKKDASHYNTNIETQKNDGYSLGKQIGFSFDENGQVTYHYDNGQTEQGIHVALARFDDLEHSLIQGENNLFRAKQPEGINIGRPNQHGFGTIKAKQLEASNVDSTMEFSNIVVLQRMFQACSQLMDIDKQLLDALEK